MAEYQAELRAMRDNCQSEDACPNPKGAALYDKPLLADTPAVRPRTGPGRVYAASVDSWIGLGD
jgi:hypothetical protein